ncbi:MAG: N-6 DNA methylase [Methanothrix sp.]|nr:N-6 DNA methylase [Methanothrix sp.]
MHRRAKKLQAEAQGEAQASALRAPAKIIELVEKFERDQDIYRSSQYNETELRTEFINPFFEALGWDVYHKQECRADKREVKEEDAVDVEGKIKNPDYSFRLFDKRKFFVEVKRPSINIESGVYPAYQIRRYAWSADLAISILTDFEEFSVYYCRARPSKDDKSTKSRLLYFRYDQYAEKWPEIAALFSREAVLNGSLDKYVQSLPQKRGDKRVDAALLDDISLWREALAKSIARHNPDLDTTGLNYAVQTIIDRIIFLRICEDRGIERYMRLKDLLNGERVYPRLCELFLQADERYNSGIFHFSKEPGRENPDTITPGLVIDDDTLKNIIKRLYFPESPYEFSVLPAEILGQIYEQFLGKVIRLDEGHNALVEDKPEVKKAGGVKYTPAYIVEYIVQNTTAPLLQGKTLQEAASLRVLDPACGSGSFLIVAYQHLLDWHKELYIKNLVPLIESGRNSEIRRLLPVATPTKGKKSRNHEPELPVYLGRGGEWKLTTAERKRILLNNIFGVDIDRQAVEVTKLSLLLKVLEGENEETISKQLTLFSERALPDLGNNIKCGNSLVGWDILESNPGLGAEEIARINPFDWEREFPEVFQRGGFDVVIGNPPYGAELLQIGKDYLKVQYNTFVSRGESYLIFVEKAVRLLKLKGVLGYIIPDTYLNLGFTLVLRSFLLRNTKIDEIVLLNSNVFNGVTVDTTLLFAKREKETQDFHESKVSIKLIDKKAFINSIENNYREFSVSTSIWHELGSFNIISNLDELNIINTIENKNIKLSEVAEMFSGIKAYEVGKGNPPQTKMIRDSKPYTSENRLEDSWLPLHDGKHIGRYQLLWKQNNWISYGQWLAAPRKPENFVGEKILIRKIVGKTLIAMHIPETSYCNTLLFILKIKPAIKFSYLYLLGILNSQFIGWYFRKKFQISAEDTFPQIMIRDILQLFVPTTDVARHDRMVSLVERMLALHKQLPETATPHEKTALQRQIEATDGQIDALVYELYGLTEEEIGIVEGKTGCEKVSI